jgi:hypothetical protein
VRTTLARLGQQGLAACLILSLALGTSWAMVGARAETSATPAHHGSHHTPGNQQTPHQHHAGACCDLCVVHCISHIGFSRIETPAASITVVIRVIPGPRYRAPADLRLRHYHPLSQAPPTLLG